MDWLDPDVTRTGNGGNEHGEREIEKLEQSREFKMKLLIALGLKLGFVSIFHFPIPRYRSPHPVPPFSNICCSLTQRKTTEFQLLEIYQLFYPVHGNENFTSPSTGPLIF